MFTIAMRGFLSLFVFFVFYSTLQVYGQSSKSYKIVSRSQNGLLYLDEAKQLEKSDPARAIDLLQQSLQEAVTTKDYGVEGESYFLLGKINANSGQYDLAIDYYNKAKIAFQRDDNSNGTYKVTKALAIAYMKNKSYDSALEEYERFLTLAKERSAIVDQIETHQARAAIYETKKEYELSLKELDLAESLSELNDEGASKLPDLKNQRGNVYEAQSNNEAAYVQYRLSEEIAKSTNDKRGVLNSNSLQSKLLDKQGKKKEAVKKRKESLSLFKEEKITETSGNTVYNEVEDLAEDELLEQVLTEDEPLQKLDETRANIDIAKTYIELDSAEEAIGYLETAINISSNSGIILEEKEAYGLLSEALSKSGRDEDALKAYKSYVSLVDSIYQLKEADILASLDLNNELSKRLQRINSLEKDRSLQEKTIELLESQRIAEEERNKQLQLLVYSLLIGILLMLLLVYFMNKNSKQRRISNQLLALKNLRTQMNPHFIFNALNSVNNFISQNDERSANKYLSDFSRLMRLVLENSEHDFISLNKELEILKIYVGLEHSRFSEKFDFEVKIDPNLDIDKYLIPPMIVQPYIENAVWHGLRYLEEKGMLIVSAKEESDVLIIQVEDNGIGRTKSLEMKTKNQKSNDSTAMKNIAERLKIMNKLHQSSVSVSINDVNADGSGTRVTINVPLKQ